LSDLAQLGISIDSSSAVVAKTALTGLTSAANAAAGAVGSLSAAGTPASAAMAKFAGANDNAAESLRKQHQVFQGLRTDLALLGPQFGGVIGTLGALYVENAHVVEGMGGLRSALGELITPQRLLIGGLVGIGAGSAIMLKSIADAKVALADLGDRSNTSLASIQALSSGGDERYR
jgi:hypothetical protein